INIRVFIDLFYLFQQFLFAYLLLQPHQSGGKTHLLTGLYFGSHIGLAGSVIAHQHRCQMGCLAPFSFDLQHPLCNLVFYLFGSFLSVYDDWHSYTFYFGSPLLAFFPFSFHFNTASRTRNAHYLKSRSQTNTHSVAAVDRGPSTMDCSRKYLDLQTFIFPLLSIQFQHRHKGLLRHLYVAYLTHTLLAFLLLLQQLSLSGDIPTIAFGQYVFTHRFHCFPGDNLTSDSRLNCNFKHLSWHEFLQLLTQPS